MKVEVTDLTESEIRLFKENKVWRCIADTIKDRLELTSLQISMAPKDDIFGEVTDDFGNTRTVLTLAGVNRLQGMMSEDMSFLDMPESFLQEKLVDKGEDK